MNDYHLQYLKNIPAGIDKSDFQPRDGDKQKPWGEREESIQKMLKLISRFSREGDLIKTDSNVKESFLKTNGAV